MKNKSLYIHKSINFNDVYVISIILTIQVVNFVYIIYYLFKEDYLPHPFFIDKNDTFMDFFNPLYWATDPGRYTEWSSVYPPLVFIFLKFTKLFFLGFDYHANSFEMRNSGATLIVIFVLSSLISLHLTLNTNLFKNISAIYKACALLFFLMSIPFLYTLERGNLIIFCLPILAHCYDKKNLNKIISISVLINIKPYFVLLLIAFIIKNEWLNFMKSATLTIIIFIISGVLLDDNYVYFFFSLLGFSGNNMIFDPDGLLTMASSITVFSYIEEWRQNFSVTDPLWRIDFGLIYSSVIKKANITLIFLVISFVIVLRKKINFEQILSCLLLIIVNLSFSFGGYVILFYILIFPFFLQSKSTNFGFMLIVIMFMPLDLITVIDASSTERMLWLTHEVKAVPNILGAGSLLRPLMSLSLLFITAQNLWKMLDEKSLSSVAQLKQQISQHLMMQSKTVS
jgi:hypothetical protein